LRKYCARAACVSSAERPVAFMFASMALATCALRAVGLFQQCLC
jgi:hypothetical protein